MKQYKKTETGGFVEVSEKDFNVDVRAEKTSKEKAPELAEEVPDTQKEDEIKDAATKKDTEKGKETYAYSEKVADGFVWAAGISLVLTLVMHVLYGHGIGWGIMLFFFPFVGICISLVGAIRKFISPTTRAVLVMSMLVSIIGIVGAFFIYSIDTGMGRTHSVVGIETVNTDETTSYNMGVFRKNE